MAQPIKKKICMLGDAGVGKTSLIRRLVKGTFTTEYRQTAGTKISLKDIETEGGTVTLMIWDILGQEGFPALRNMYFKKAAAAVLVCDQTDSESLEKLPKWLESLHSVEPGTPVIIAANKSDDMNKVFGLDDVTTFLEEEGLEVYDTSAKTGEGVAELFSAVASLFGGAP